MSANANVALDQLMWVLGIVMGLSLTLGLVYAQIDKARERRALRARLAALPKPALADPAAFRARLLAEIPAQQDGGERRAG